MSKLLREHSIVLAVIFGIFGSIMGSFLNVVIYRVPHYFLNLDDEDEDEGEEIPVQFLPRVGFAFRYVVSLLYWNLRYLFKEFIPELWTILKRLSYPASHCYNCKKEVAFYDNIPVLSWFVLKGKCRHCNASFSVRYAAIELATALLFSFCYWHYGATLELVFILCLVVALWTIFWIDLDQQFIFNVITYPSILLGIVYNTSKGSLPQGVLGALVAALFFGAVIWGSIVFLSQEGMGGGDFNLAILLGIWLGPERLAVALALAFILGAVLGLALLAVYRESRPFPFGPALVLGGFTSLVVGKSLWAWYINSIQGSSVIGLL